MLIQWRKDAGAQTTDFDIPTVVWTVLGTWRSYRDRREDPAFCKELESIILREGTSQTGRQEGVSGGQVVQHKGKLFDQSFFQAPMTM